MTDLCGIPVSVPIGPISLARSSGVPLVPVFFFRTGRRRYDSVVREPVRVARTGDAKRDIEEAAHRVAREIEWAVRRSPHEWFCFTDLAAEARRSGELRPAEARPGRTEVRVVRPGRA
jgi:lauroyl/myristoyl acyltransferase